MLEGLDLCLRVGLVLVHRVRLNLINAMKRVPTRRGNSRSSKALLHIFDANNF